MDRTTLELLADFICGDAGPIYRSSSQLTQFFHKAGLDSFVHDGSTRKRWVLNALETLGEADLDRVVLMLADPREYRIQQIDYQDALDKLNDIVVFEGKWVKLNGVFPEMTAVDPAVSQIETRQIQNSEPAAPDFSRMAINQQLAIILEDRWSAAHICVDSEAYLMGIIAMGSLLEGLLLAAFENNPRLANQANASPKGPEGRVKPFSEWTLSNMIDVSRELGWIGLDVSKFSHSLREFRNLVHPKEQLSTGAIPDKDTCAISWEVVQAAISDLSTILYQEQ